MFSGNGKEKSFDAETIAKDFKRIHKMGGDEELPFSFFTLIKTFFTLIQRNCMMAYISFKIADFNRSVVRALDMG